MYSDLLWKFLLACDTVYCVYLEHDMCPVFDLVKLLSSEIEAKKNEKDTSPPYRVVDVVSLYFFSGSCR